jgi:5-(hydroxymethyl)furfural/furfural oxidase
MSAVAYDVIIVGGGTAGCVLAGRLSSKKDCRVLLIEAGEDLPPGHEPSAILDPYPSGYGDPSFSWPGLKAYLGNHQEGVRRPISRRFVQGRGVGGSSNIMGMMALRGSPADYDEWHELGARGWDWHGVLPYLCRLERDLDFSGPLHGSDGPIPIRRHARSDWAPFARAVAEAAEARGYSYFPDYNGQFGDGVSTVPMNNLPDRRVSTAMAYLDASVRSRPNLRIVANTTVDKVVFKGTQATGVSVLGPAGSEVIAGREIILSAGAIYSPAILLRSGIGPSAALRKLGVQPVLDRPGVGENLLNHVVVQLAIHLPRHAIQSPQLRAWAFSILRFSSAVPGCPAGDMHIVPMNKASWHPLGRRIGALTIGVRKPYSTGSVTLESADPAVNPIVRFNLLSDPRDLARLVRGVALACEILIDPRVAANRNDVFIPDMELAARLNRPGWRQWLKSRLITQVLDISPKLRRWLLRPSRIEPADLLRDERALREFVLNSASPVHHVCGTCRMGAANNPAAVVDPECRVIGATHLRVSDASIMPTITSANTHLPVVMIGEKVASMMTNGG